MHELAMAMSMVRLMVQAAGAAHARRVNRARLRIGELSCLDPRTLETAFEVAAQGTVVEGCVVEVHRIPALLRCRGCGNAHGGPLLSPCPECGDPGAEVVEGRESWVESLDVEVPEAPAPLGGSAL
jgi:hydrogenase nickel incorporation protein HypA/HybF